MFKEILNHIFKKTVKYANENRLVVLFFSVFCIGVTFGAFLLPSLFNSDFNLPLLFERFLALRSNGFSYILLNSLITYGFPLILLYCFGLFAYGYVPCFLLMFVQGITHGIVCGYTYTTYGLRGVAFVLLIVMPSALLITVIYLIGSKTSFQFSALLSKIFFCDTVLVQPSVHFKRYHYKYLILTAFAIVAALTDSLLSRIFLGVFGF